MTHQLERPRRESSSPQGRATGLRLALRGIAYRRLTAAIVLVLAVIAATAAVVAPLYSRAAEESITRSALNSSDVFARGVHADVPSNSASNAAPMASTVGELSAALRQPVFGVPLTSASTSGIAHAVAGDQAGGAVEVPLVDRAGLCDHLPVAAGRCPTAAGEVAMTTRSAQLLGLRIGDSFDEGLTDVLARDGSQQVAHLRLVGTTDPFPLDDDYWAGRDLFRFYPRARPAGLSEMPPITDTVWLWPGAAGALGIRAYSVDVTVDPRHIDLTSGPDVVASVTGVRDRLSTLGVTVTSQLPALVDSSARRSSVVRVAAPLAAFQLVLLAWVILAHVVSAATQERAPELGLAKLRGLTPGRTVRFGLAEVVVLLLVSAPIGTLLGWWLVHEVAVHRLEPGIPLRLSIWVAASVLVGVLGGIGAAALAARGVARGHVADLLRRVPGSGRGRRAGAAEGAVLALVVAAVVQLVVAPDSTPGPVASAGPGLVALGGALVAARVLRWVSRRRTSRAHDKGRPASLVGWAGVSRRAGTARTTGVLAAAICLLLVGVQAWTVAARERDARALAETGAAVVLDVQTTSPQRLLHAVRAADPGGSYAMAAMALAHDYSEPALAVDATRAAAVAGFAGRGPADLAAVLRPKTVSPLVVRTGVVRAVVTVTAVASPSPLVLSATVETAEQGWLEVDLGDLRRGSGTYSGAVPAACGSGCRLVGLTVTHPGADTTSGRATFEVRELAAGPEGSVQPLDGQFGRRGAWRPGVEDSGGARTRITFGPTLGLDVVAPGGFPARAVHGDAPYPLPALVAPGTLPRDGLVPVTGPDGVRAEVAAARDAPFVPRLGQRGVLVDLELLLRGVANAQPTNLQVWLTRDDPGAERSLGAALAADQVQVTARSSAAQATERLAGEGAVLALLLFLGCGAVALLVAVGAVLVAAFVGSRQRSVEVAALRTVGVPRKVLHRALLLENLAGVGVALACAVVAAVVVALVVLPVLPLADEVSQVLVPSPDPDVPTLIATAAAVAALLTALAVAIASAQLRSGTADRMREGSR